MALFTGLISFYVAADAQGVFMSLDLPDKEPDASLISQQVYFVDHFYAFENLQMGYKTKNRMLLLSHANNKTLRIDSERLINHRPDDQRLKTQDLVIFRSGKLRGTGILVLDYQQLQPMQIRMWLPSLRKIRRFSEPDQDDIWGGSQLTYGDIYLRRPHHEFHQLQDKQSRLDCLGDVDDFKHWADDLVKAELKPWCELAEKRLYLVKSMPVTSSDSYDYRLRWIDSTSFAEYQVEYYQQGQLVKRVQKNWHHTDKDDPRAQIWNFWSVKVFDQGKLSGESLAWLADEDYRWDQRLPSRLWSEQALKKIRR